MDRRLVFCRGCLLHEFRQVITHRWQPECIPMLIHFTIFHDEDMNIDMVVLLPTLHPFPYIHHCHVVAFGEDDGGLNAKAVE